ncbi:hypothetical protein GIB67_023859 [Kingdonia uniflora]|uniref:Cytochrome P450 n=1 Tax=Kingdonia uniflora TaxID=39325 RepID=A0A7J7NFY3_9MAGN|nr:hypothetical protein GIB67_023859 [Kingdonia uniflora]
MLKKAQKEIDFHIGKERNVEETDINNLGYLQAIVKEALKLYPPLPLGLPHVAIEDCTVGGLRIPSRHTCFIEFMETTSGSICLVIYPLEFQPERFLTSHAVVNVRGQHVELLPFGVGKRSCPRTSFSLNIIHLALGRLVHGFEMTAPSEMPVDMTSHSVELP